MGRRGWVAACTDTPWRNDSCPSLAERAGWRGRGQTPPCTETPRKGQMLSLLGVVARPVGWRDGGMAGRRLRRGGGEAGQRAENQQSDRVLIFQLREMGQPAQGRSWLAIPRPHENQQSDRVLLFQLREMGQPARGRIWLAIPRPPRISNRTRKWASQPATSREELAGNSKTSRELAIEPIADLFSNYVKWEPTQRRSWLAVPRSPDNQQSDRLLISGGAWDWQPAPLHACRLARWSAV